MNIFERLLKFFMPLKKEDDLLEDKDVLEVEEDLNIERDLNNSKYEAE